MPGERYQNRTRIRVNGLLITDKSILLVQIESPVTNERVWMPPGGGLRFGESMSECLQREFKEETGLKIDVGSLVAVNELVQPPFHAVECYFEVHKKGGTLHVGNDPEHDAGRQILKDVQWIQLSKLNEISIAPKQLQQWVADMPLQNKGKQRYFLSNE